MELFRFGARNDQKSGRPRGSRLARAVALVLGALIVVPAAALPAHAEAPTARVATGTINSLTMSVLYDGQIPNDLDDDPNNGIVASNDVVGFQWVLNATDLHNGVLQQTLPEGWSWAPDGLVPLNATTDRYSSVSSVSPDGRTVTATINTLQPGNPVLMSFGALRAIPSGDVPNNSVYTPELLGTDGTHTQTALTTDITVVNKPKAELRKSFVGVFAGTTPPVHDFADGVGAVAARYIDYRLSIDEARDQFAIGARNISFAQPLVMRDTFTVTGSNADAGFQAQITATSDPTANVGLNQSGRTFEVSLDGFNDLPSAWVDVRLWVRNTDLPASGSLLTVVNTVAPDGDWLSTEGDSVAVDTTNAGVTRGLSRPATTTTASSMKGIYLYKDQNANGDITGDPFSLTSEFVSLTNGVPDADREMAPGSLIAARILFNPSSADSLSNGATNLVSYDFWNPAEQQIVDGAKLFVGQNWASSSIASNLFTVQYTNGTNSGSPEQNTWVDSVAEAGGVAKVAGIRVAYTGSGGVWKKGASASTSWFTVGIPFRLVAAVGTKVSDQGVWRSSEEPAGRTTSSYIFVGSYRISTGIQSSSSSITSGSQIDYTVHPVITAPPGAEYTATIQDLAVEVTLPSGLLSVELGPLPDGWRLVETGDANSGMTLRYEYEGEWDTSMTAPAFSYSVKTSFLAPTSSALKTTAVISAAGTLQDLDTRSETNTVSVQQTAAVTIEKSVIGNTTLQPGDTAVWEARWYNTTVSSEGKSYFVDVLPWNTDPRGSSFSGKLKLTEAELTGSFAGALHLQYTIADSASLSAADASDNSFGWVDADGVDLADIDGITGLRVIVDDFVSTGSGYIGLQVSALIDGQLEGDRLVNTVHGTLGVNGVLGQSNPAEVAVVAGSLSGAVWLQAPATGRALAADQQPVVGAQVALFDDADEQIAVATTDADGAYEFGSLREGTYRTVVDAATLGATGTQHVVNIVDHDDDLNSDSGPVVVGLGEHVVDIDFGYRFDGVAIALEKTGTLAADAVVGSLVSWDFVITNTGDADLTDVELVDHLAGVSDIVIDWGEATPGALAIGDSVSASATSALTVEQLAAGAVTNTATVTAVGPASIVVSADAEATVTASPLNPGGVNPGGGNSSGGNSSGGNVQGGNNPAEVRPEGNGGNAATEVPSTQVLSVTGVDSNTALLAAIAALLLGICGVFVARIRQLRKQ